MKSFRSVDRWGNVRYKNERGQWHREDGPAYEEPGGFKAWFINGKVHREDGPAIEYSDDSLRYYLNDIKYSVEDWEREILKLKLERIKNL